MHMSLKALAAAAFLSGVTFAASAANARELAPYGQARSLPATIASYSELQFDVSDILSNDEIGAAINEVYNLDLGAGAHITGIGWDIDLYADTPSWLSEIAVQFSATDQLNWVSLTPGLDDDFSGSGSYSSGGVIDLVSLGYDFYLNDDGLLRLEFFEQFDDYPGDWDGLWESGFLTIAYEGGTTPPTPGVPEPTTWAMMIGGLALAGGLLRRSRTAQAKVSFS